MPTTRNALLGFLILAMLAAILGGRGEPVAVSSSGDPCVGGERYIVYGSGLGYRLRLWTADADTRVDLPEIGARGVCARPSAIAASGLTYEPDPLMEILPVAAQEAEPARAPDPRYQWHLTTIQAPRAWDAGMGAGVTVAVIDTGVDCSHLSLKGQCVPGIDYIAPRGDTALGDLPPMPAAGQSRDVLVSDAVGFGQNAGVDAGPDHELDPLNIGIGDFHRPTGPAPLGDHVPSVVLDGAQEHVIGVDAPGHIAAVADIHPFGDGTERHFPGEAMSVDRLDSPIFAARRGRAIPAKMAVVCASCPENAAAGAGLGQSGEAIGRGLVGQRARVVLDEPIGLPLDVASSGVVPGNDARLLAASAVADAESVGPVRGSGATIGARHRNLHSGEPADGDTSRPAFLLSARNYSTKQGNNLATCGPDINCDFHGHGTHVAGLVADLLDGYEGSGVAPLAKIRPMRVLNSGGWGDTATIARAILDSANAGDAVINLSLGGPDGSQALRDAVAYAGQRGAIVVVARGNGGGQSRSYPVCYEPTVGVAATGTGDTRADFSDYGPCTDTAAPGVSLMAPWPGGSYRALSGTSMAAPVTAGVLALLVGLGDRDPVGTLLATDIRLPDQSIPGRVDALAAVLAVQPGPTVTPGPIPTDPPTPTQAPTFDPYPGRTATAAARTATPTRPAPTVTRATATQTRVPTATRPAPTPTRAPVRCADLGLCEGAGGLFGMRRVCGPCEAGR